MSLEDGSRLIAASAVYFDAGLQVLPASKKDKCPIHGNGSEARWKPEKVGRDEAVTRWKGLSDHQDAIGLVCGEISGGVECIDFDHAGKQYEAWRALIPCDLLNRLVIEKSQRGGYHVGYRCNKIDGNTKLSLPPKPVEKGAEWSAYI